MRHLLLENRLVLFCVKVIFFLKFSSMIYYCDGLYEKMDIDYGIFHIFHLILLDFEGIKYVEYFELGNDVLDRHERLTKY